MQDMIDRLARELSQAPEPGFDIASTVASGRKAVRRRRTAAGGVVLAAALVIGGTAWLVAPGNDDEPDSSQVAHESTPTAPATTAPVDPGDATTDVPLLVQPDGSVVVHADAQVLEQGTYTAPTGEVATTYHVRLHGAEYYALTVPTDGTVSWVPLPAQGLSLRDWAARDLAGPQIADDEWVRFDNGSHLVTVLDGLTIVRQLPDPGLGANFAGPGEPTALAEVVLDGVTWYLTVRAIPGGPVEAIPYRRDAAVSSLEQFRTYALHQYAENESGGSEGLR